MAIPCERGTLSNIFTTKDTKKKSKSWYSFVSFVSFVVKIPFGFGLSYLGFVHLVDQPQPHKRQIRFDDLNHIRLRGDQWRKSSSRDDTRVSA